MEPLEPSGGGLVEGSTSENGEFEPEWRVLRVSPLYCLMTCAQGRVNTFNSTYNPPYPPFEPK